MRAKFKQLGKESLIYGVAGMLQRFIAVLLLPLYTKVFSPHEYGVQGLVVAAMALISTVAVLGMDSATHTWFWHTEDEADRRVTVASAFWCQLTAALLLAAPGLACAPLLARAVFGEEETAPLLRLAFVALPLSVSGTVLISWLRLQRRPVATMWFSILSNLLLIALNLVFILALHWGLEGLFRAQIAAGALTTIAAVWIMRRTIRLRDARLSRLREMLRFALPLVPAALAFWVMNLSDRLFIERLAGTAEVGLYQIAASLAAGVAMVTGAFTMAWSPFALSLQRQPEAPALYARAMLLYLALGGCMVTAVSLFAREAILLLARPEYLGAVPVVGILGLGVLANGLSYVAGTGLSLAKKSTPITVAVFLAAAVNMALNALFVPRIGKTGAALAAAVSWTVYTGWIFVSAQRLHPLPFDPRRGLLIGAVIAGIVCGAPHLAFGSLLLDVAVKAAAGLALAALLFTIALPGWPGMLRRAVSPLG